MKRHIKTFAFIFLLGFVTIQLVSCKGDDDGGGDDKITPEEVAVLTDLIGTWNLTSVTQDDEAPQIGDYSSMILTVGASTEDASAGKVYSVTGGGPVFPDVTDAVWSFVDGSNFAVIERADGSLVRVNEVTSSSLILQLDQDDEIETEGRVQAIGRYIFTFSK